MSTPRAAPGPFHVGQLREGDRYELTQGHPVYAAPAGGQHGGANVTGALPLATDPAVESAGVDVGYSPDPKTLRAPDIAVGNVPMKPGWVQGAPPLAVEYSDTGQDEAELQTRIVELLAAGTRWVWVVRLVGVRRVEVYEPGKAPRTVGPGETLTAPGVLRNALPVEALWDRGAAIRATLRNLLQREGYADLDAVRAEGRDEGAVEGLRTALLAVYAARFGATPDAVRDAVRATADAATLTRWTALFATGAADAIAAAVTARG